MIRLVWGRYCSCCNLTGYCDFARLNNLQHLLAESQGQDVLLLQQVLLKSSRKMNCKLAVKGHQLYQGIQTYSIFVGCNYCFPRSVHNIVQCDTCELDSKIWHCSSERAKWSLYFLFSRYFCRVNRISLGKKGGKPQTQTKPIPEL